MSFTSSQSPSSALRPHKPAVLVLHNRFAGRERLPQVDEEVGALLNVLVAEHRGNGPCGFLGVVEGDAAVWDVSAGFE
jgi:hypothetical protein